MTFTETPPRCCVYFSPKLLHATQGWKGERFSLTAFASRGLPELNQTDITQSRLIFLTNLNKQSSNPFKGQPFPH